MVGYDKQSHEGTMTDLSSIFTLPLTDVTTTNVKCVEYFPISSIDKKANTLEFNLSSSDHYLDIASLLLSISGQFNAIEDDTKKPGQDETKKFTCVNLLLHALIEKVEIFINNKEVINLSNYGIAAYLNLLLNATDVERKTSFKTQGFIPHTVGKSDDLSGNALTGGLLERYNAIKDSKKIHLIGPLFTGLTSQRKFLVPGLSLRIKLHLQKNSFFILENNVSPFYQFELTNATIKIKHIEIPLQIKYGLEKTAQTENFVYALPDYSIVTRYIAAGAQAYTFENLGHIYSRCYVLFADSKAMEGDPTLNPFKFGNYNITSIKLSRGSEQYIYDNIDFANKNYGEVYLELVRCLGGSNVPLTPAEFEEEACIFPFNLTLSNPNASLPTRNENMTRLQVSFKEPLTKQLCVIFFITNPKIMSVSASRQVLLR
jgi:hypothetical protein